MVWILFAVVVILISVIVSDNEKEAERKIARKLAEQKMNSSCDFSYNNTSSVSNSNRFTALSSSKVIPQKIEMTELDFKNEYQILQNLLFAYNKEFHLILLSSSNPDHWINKNIIKNNIMELLSLYNELCTSEVWTATGSYEDRLSHMKKLVFDFKNNVENLLK